jgi:hypothetical protein
MPLLPILLGAGSLLGGILGSRQRQRQTTTGTTSGTSTTTPTFTPEVSPLINPLVQASLRRLRNPASLPFGYEAGGIDTINRGYDAARLATQNRLTAAGIGGGEAEAAALGGLDLGRAGEIVGFQNQLPLIARDLQNQDLAQALAIAGIGRGQSTTSTGTTTGEATTGQTGGLLGGLGAGFTDLASLLGFLYGQGAFGRGGGAARGDRIFGSGFGG